MPRQNARPTLVDGIRFHSGKEAARYLELKLLERAGRIAGLELQVKYSLDANGHHICNYIADFRYTEDGEVVVEDVKGYTGGLAYRLYKIKAALMLAIHGIEVFET